MVHAYAHMLSANSNCKESDFPVQKMAFSISENL